MAVSYNGKDDYIAVSAVDPVELYCSVYYNYLPYKLVEELKEFLRTVDIKLQYMVFNLVNWEDNKPYILDYLHKRHTL